MMHEVVVTNYYSLSVERSRACVELKREYEYFSNSVTHEGRI